EFRRVLFRSCFFFSSRRRHTRFSRDWSSDVCSSDLGFAGAVRAEDADARAGRQLQLDVVQDGRAVIAQNALAQIQQRVGLAIGRSEERRVGEACGSGRWWSRTKRDSALARKRVV